MGKLTTIPLLLKTSPAALPAYLCGAMALYLLYKLATSSLAAISSIGYPPLGLACRWSGESLASFTLNFPAVPNSGTRMR